MDEQAAYKSGVNPSPSNYHATSNDHPTSVKHGIKGKLISWLGLNNHPIVKVYHGYGHEGSNLVFGHVLALSPKPRKKYRQNLLANIYSLLKSFMVRPIAGAKLRLKWEGQWIYSHTEDDGFYKFEWDPPVPMAPDWYEVEIELLAKDQAESVIAKGKGSIYIPPNNQFGCISDIDDTFLISHSARIFKRLGVLLSRNAHSRKPFEGVVKHYQLLAKAAAESGHPNPFFYVSSSEWNLYDFILEFSRKNNLPEGVFLLNQMKKLHQAFMTGQGKHSTKFMRIARILENYPHQRFILLGDSSQQDPDIYSAVVSHFPKQIHAIYIRDVHQKNHAKVKEILIKMEQLGIPCCFFKHSRDAIHHSQRIGLITREQLAD